MAKIVYYSMTDKTRRFVSKLDSSYESFELSEATVATVMDEDFIAVVPAYATEQDHDEFGIQELFEDFLHTSDNLERCKGIFSSGNIHFGPLFAITGKDLAQKFNIPLLHCFEMFGSQLDVDKMNEELERLDGNV